MNKKYFPFLALIAVVLVFIWIKQHQRGKSVQQNVVMQTDPAAFNRNVHLVYSTHAKCRMECRHIDEEEVKEILQDGTINYSKVEEDTKGRTYPLEGITRDKQHVRIVFAPHQNEIVVVTVIDLDKDWPCNCN